MFRALYLNRIRGYAQSLLKDFLPSEYEGEVFLCGGAFKPLLNKRLPHPEMDLWVRSAEDREALCLALHGAGGHLIENLYPHCLKFRLEGLRCEVHYHDVGEGSLAALLGVFDLALCGVGVRWQQGQVEEAEISDACWRALCRRQVMVMDHYLDQIALQKAPCLLRIIHRMGQQATDLEFTVDQNHEQRLWDMYWNHYTEEERQAALDLYFSTVVAHRGQHDEHLMRLVATAGGTAPLAGCLQSSGV